MDEHDQPTATNHSSLQEERSADTNVNNEVNQEIAYSVAK